MRDPEPTLPSALGRLVPPFDAGPPISRRGLAEHAALREKRLPLLLGTEHAASFLLREHPRRRAQPHLRSGHAEGLAPDGAGSRPGGELAMIALVTGAQRLSRPGARRPASRDAACAHGPLPRPLGAGGPDAGALVGGHTSCAGPRWRSARCRTRPSCRERWTAADVLYHLAASPRGAAADIFLNTVVASQRLLDGMRATGTRPHTVLVSSFGVYGVAEPAERRGDRRAHAARATPRVAGSLLARQATAGAPRFATSPVTKGSR